MRLDKFLKVSRILKRRTVAAEACRAGKVTVNGRDAKPAHTLKVGDEVELFFAAGSLKFRVLQLKESVKKRTPQKCTRSSGTGSKKACFTKFLSKEMQEISVI